MQDRPIRAVVLANLEQRLSDAEKTVNAAVAEKQECEELIALLKRDYPEIRPAEPENVPVEGPYSGMTIVTAAVKYLGTVSEAQPSKKIAAELMRGGLDLRGKYPAASVQTLLTAEKNNGGLVDSERRGRATYWSLAKSEAVALPLD